MAKRKEPPKGLGKYPVGSMVWVDAEVDFEEVRDLGVPEQHYPPIWGRGMVVAYTGGLHGARTRYPYLVLMSDGDKYTYAEDELGYEE